MICTKRETLNKIRYVKLIEETGSRERSMAAGGKNNMMRARFWGSFAPLIVILNFIVLHIYFLLFSTINVSNNYG